MAEFVIKRGGIKLEQDKASTGAGGGGKLETVPYVVRRFHSEKCRKRTWLGSTMGRFPGRIFLAFTWRVMVGHDFFKPYAMTFDFENMKIILSQ